MQKQAGAARLADGSLNFTSGTPRAHRCHVIRITEFRNRIRIRAPTGTRPSLSSVFITFRPIPRMRSLFQALTVAVLLTLAACGGSSNPGVIFDPNPPGSGGGGGGGGVVKGPAGAPAPGALSVSGSPSVINTGPTGTNISVETPICVTFSESVQVATVSSTTLVLRVQQGQTIQATISNFGGGRFFVLIPNSPLPVNRTIEIFASNLIRDLDGNPLTVPTGGVIGSFTTEVTADTQKVPSVVAQFPPKGAKNVPAGTANFGAGVGAIPGIPTQVFVVFSEPIAPSTILGDLTPPPSPEKLGLRITQSVDPDGSGPAPPALTLLIPGTGAALLPFNDNRVWIATPFAPFAAGATVDIGVGPAVKNDDVQPQGVFPIYTGNFTIALLEAPQFTNIDITPATAAELSPIPAFLNNVATLPNSTANPVFAGKFAVGVVFGAGSLATDTLEIALSNPTGGGNVLFSRKSRLGAGQQNYTDLSILGTDGKSKLSQGSVVLSARTRRGSVTSAWTVGPPVGIDTLNPTILNFGPPSEGATILTTGRLAPVYGTASEAAFSLIFTNIESPVGTVLPPPIPSGLSGHLLATTGNLFFSIPVVPAPPVTTPVLGTAPDEPRSKARLQLADAAGNTNTAQDVNLVFRGRLGGPGIATQNALTVVVYDEDTLATVPNAVVLVDNPTPSGSATGQTLKSVSLSTTTGLTQATFVAPADFQPGTPSVTVTASAPGYDIVTVVGVPVSFASIPIRKTRGTTSNDPLLSIALASAPSGGTVDVSLSARPDLGDPFLVTSTQSLGGLPVIAATSVASFRPLRVSAFVRNAGAFTYLNDAFVFPQAPVALSGVSSTTATFGQSFSQTTDTADDPENVPPGGGIGVTLPGTPFDATTAAVETGLFTPGQRLGIPGQIAIGAGRTGVISGVNVSVATSFDPNSDDEFVVVDPGQNPPFGTVVPAPVSPNSAPTDARVVVRAQDQAGAISRAMVRSATTVGGAIAGITLPDVPSVLAPVSSGGGTSAPKIKFTDTLSSGNDLYIAKLRMKQQTPVRVWDVYLLRSSGDVSVPGEVSIQLPSIAAFSGVAGTPIPSAGALLDQTVDAIVLPGLQFTDFFFDDLRQAQPDVNVEDPVTFARSPKAEIIY